MGGKSFRFALVLMAAMSASSAEAASAPICKLGQAAELRVTMEGLWPTVNVKINGQVARFVVDSGAFYSVITPGAAERFGMRTSALPAGFYLQGAVGRTSGGLGQAAEFGLDKATLKNVDFLVAGDTLGDADGLLGQNVL